MRRLLMAPGMPGSADGGGRWCCREFASKAAAAAAAAFVEVEPEEEDTLKPLEEEVLTSRPFSEEEDPTWPLWREWEW